MMVRRQYDVLIVGGSYAGLSAALVLGRSLRQVLVIDAGQPANRQTPHTHGFLTRDGETPAVLSAIAYEQVSHYPTVQFWTDTAVRAVQSGPAFRVTTGGGVQFQARKLLLATGVADIMPDLPGFAECWGRSVLHCPYCHGYEVHGQPLGVLANGEVGYEMILHIQHWSDLLTLYTNGPSTLTGPQQQMLTQLGVSVVETPIATLEHKAGMLTALLLTNGNRMRPTAIFARVPFRQHTDIATQLGCSLTENGLIDATEFGETSVPGVFGAGDATALVRQVSIAVANGTKAGVWINRELVTDDLRQRTQPVSIDI
ncbi:NAD(P)/FAD-dependent oxidoreductase [Spirosoma arcticum]